MGPAVEAACTEGTGQPHACARSWCVLDAFLPYLGISDECAGVNEDGLRSTEVNRVEFIMQLENFDKWSCLGEGDLAYNNVRRAWPPPPRAAEVRFSSVHSEFG